MEFEWANQKISKLKYNDMQLIKIAVAGFVLMIAKLWPTILALDWYWYLAIMIVAMIKPMYKVFS